MSEKRDMSGIILRNEKRLNDKHPEYTGSCTIAGVDYWISAWVKSGAKGKFFSCAFKPKTAPANQPASPQPEAGDSDVPF